MTEDTLPNFSVSSGLCRQRSCARNFTYWLFTTNQKVDQIPRFYCPLQRWTLLRILLILCWRISFLGNTCSHRWPDSFNCRMKEKSLKLFLLFSVNLITYLQVAGKDLREATHEHAVEVIRSADSPVNFLVQSLVSASVAKRQQAVEEASELNRATNLISTMPALSASQERSDRSSSSLQSSASEPTLQHQSSISTSKSISKESSEESSDNSYSKTTFRRQTWRRWRFVVICAHQYGDLTEWKFPQCPFFEFWHYGKARRHQVSFRNRDRRETAAFGT